MWATAQEKSKKSKTIEAIQRGTVESSKSDDGKQQRSETKKQSTVVEKSDTDENWTMTLEKWRRDVAKAKNIEISTIAQMSRQKQDEVSILAKVLYVQGPLDEGAPP